MAGNGFGFGAHRTSRRLVALGRNNAPPVAVPSAAWNGNAGSGFGNVPVDPARVTAKPAMRLLTPPNQFFTEELVIGVYAGANAAGSMLRTMGLAKVLVHYEGATYTIDAPSLYLYEDANGQFRRLFGWWIALSHNGTNGNAHVYFEAVPKDTTMQHRVMGPYQFSPAATAHDYDLTVAATGPTVTGASYQSIPAALAYLKSVSAANPRITVTQTGTYDLGIGAAPAYQGAGYCTIRATVPITIARGLPYNGTSYLRTRYDGMKFTGSNITFDMAYLSQVYHDGSERQNWFDGVNFINSLGRDSLWMGAGRPASWLALGAPYFTECEISGLSDVGKGAGLLRGCTLSNGYKDCVTGAKCIVGNVTSDWNSSFFSNDVPAFTVTYNGASAAATLQLSGSNDANNRVFTARVDGVTVGTFTVVNSLAGYNANTNFTVQNVVTWLNSLPGWSATVLDNTRRATACGLPGTKGFAFGQQNVKSTNLTVSTALDYHSDWYQQGDTENVVIADNLAYGVRAQILFIAKNPAADFLVINNCFGGNGVAFGTSQLAQAHSHVVIVHNSWCDQALALRTDTGQNYNPDAYCLIANNVVAALSWTGPEDGDVAMKDNHIYGGETPPMGATGTTVGGDRTTLFTNALAGDFTPAGPLLTTLRSPVVGSAFRGKLRRTLSTAGAIDQ